MWSAVVGLISNTQDRGPLGGVTFGTSQHIQRKIRLQYLKISNWEKWQTYRADRGRPPWIKIHRCLMSNPEWVQLTDSQRGRLVLLWILAAERDGEIPSDPKLLRKICFMDKEPELQLFIKFGFIEDDANVTSTWRQDDVNVTPQTRARESDAESDAEADAEKTLVPPPKAEVAPEARAAAVLLSRLMTANDPKANVPKTATALQGWHTALDRLHRIDGRPWPEIEAVIKWSQADDFWRGNILSAISLRKQFPKLRAKMSPTGAPPPTAATLTGPIIASLEFEYNDGGLVDAEEWIKRQPPEQQPLLRDRLSFINGRS